MAIFKTRKHIDEETRSADILFEEAAADLTEFESLDLELKETEQELSKINDRSLRIEAGRELENYFLEFITKNNVCIRKITEIPFNTSVKEWTKFHYSTYKSREVGYIYLEVYYNSFYKILVFIDPFYAELKIKDETKDFLDSYIIDQNLYQSSHIIQRLKLNDS